MNDVVLVLINHNIRGGTIIVNNLLVLRLADNKVFGSMIGKEIQCIETGLDPDSQSFQYVCFGKCSDYIGPQCNASLFEVMCFTYLNLSLIMICCGSIVSCQKQNFCCLLRRQFKSLSHVFEISLYTSSAMVVFTLFQLLIFQYIFKRLDAKLNHVGFIWLIMNGLPYFVFIVSVILGIGYLYT